MSKEAEAIQKTIEVANFIHLKRRQPDSKVSIKLSKVKKFSLVGE